MQNFLLTKNLSANSIKRYLYWINVYLQFARNNHSQDMALQFKSHCLTAYQVATQRLIFTSLNYYLEYVNDALRISLPAQRFTFRKETINEQEFKAIINNLVNENERVSMRNRELMHVLWNTGMRIGEALNLEWKHVGALYLHVESSKTKTMRFIPYYEKLFDELKKIKNSKYVFSTNDGQKMTYSNAYRLFKECNKPGFSPHTLRHSFATRLLKNGVPLNYVSNLLGHASLDTTLIYLHYQNEDIRNELIAKDWH